MDLTADPATDPPTRGDVQATAATAPGSQLVDNTTTEHYRQLVAAGAERVARNIAAADSPWTGASPDELAAELAEVDLERPLENPTAALDELERVYLRDAVYFHHPRYLAHLNCPVAAPALLGETVLAAINSSLDTWDQSAGATLIEQRLIDWTAGRVGLGERADGVFTSGGTQSNLQGLLLARDEACRRHREQSPTPIQGPEIMSRLRIFTAQHSHFSVTTAADLLGLDAEAVIPVPCDQDRRMRSLALARELDRCHRANLIPMAVVATAGTTDFGSIDPLPEIANLCAQEGVWMHVDAAYGCGLLVSRRRHLLDGIERADSVTVDYHKAFFQPVSSSAILVRDSATLRHVTHHAAYLNPAGSAEDVRESGSDGSIEGGGTGGVPNHVDKSIQTTRRFDALKLWMTLRIMGADAIGELFDEVVDRAHEAWRLLAADSRFEVVTSPELSTLVFRYVPPPATSPELCDRANLSAREGVAGAGQAAVGRTAVDGRTYLKFTLLNPRTSQRDIAEVLDLLAEHAGRYLDEQAPAGCRQSRAG